MNMVKIIEMMKERKQEYGRRLECRRINQKVVGDELIQLFNKYLFSANFLLNQKYT